MKVEIVSIGTKLLMSEILDTNTPYISRTLREVDAEICCKVTVGNDAELIQDVIQVALKRADVVLTIGDQDDDFSIETQRALARAAGREMESEGVTVAGVELWSGRDNLPSGFLLENSDASLIYLPGDRRKLAYLMDNRVLPYLSRRYNARKGQGWVVLRTVDIMESSLKQELADLALTSEHRITYESFAGQTNIHLWVEGGSAEQIQADLHQLKEAVVSRLGDHIYGEGEDRLEDVVLDLLKGGNKRLIVGEYDTKRRLSQTLKQGSGLENKIAIVPIASIEAFANQLGIKGLSPDEDVAVWCQTAAEKMRARSNTDLGLLVYKDVSQGGMQIFTALASPHGASVTRRSFGGHPENIDDWAYTVGLAHLRRWLLVHR